MGRRIRFGTLVVSTGRARWETWYTWLGGRAGCNEQEHWECKAGNARQMRAGAHACSGVFSPGDRRDSPLPGDGNLTAAELPVRQCGLKILPRPPLPLPLVCFRE